MKRIAALLALAAATGATVVGHAAGSGAANPKAIAFLDIPASGTPVGDAAGHRNPRPGDEVLLVDRLYAWNGVRRGAQIGHTEATLTFRSGFTRTGASVYIVGQFFLPSGTVVVEGFTRLAAGPSAFTLPIVGGTGKYAGARGTLDTRDIGRSGKSSMTLNFVDPS